MSWDNKAKLPPGALLVVFGVVIILVGLCYGLGMMS